MRFNWILFFTFAAIGIVGFAGLVVSYLTWRWKRWQAPPPACEIRTFDYITFLTMVRKAIKRAEEDFLQVSSDPNLTLANERRIYLETKITNLNSLISVVEKQIEKGGDTYACYDAGYNLFMNEIDYPTFSSMRCEEQTRRILEELQGKSKSSKVKVLEYLNVFVALIPALTGVGGLILQSVIWYSSKDDISTAKQSNSIVAPSSQGACSEPCRSPDRKLPE